jgi:hypothetical protein
MKGLQKSARKLDCKLAFELHLQDRTANLAHLAAIFYPDLVCPQKALVN